MTNDNAPAIWEMVVVHRVFRREFRLAPELVRQVAPGDTERAATLAAYLGELLTGLHHHHEAEDKLLWPVLLRRVQLESVLIRTMEEQHERVADHISVLEELLPAWRAEADAERRDRLADTLTLLHDELLVHLDQEEERILPLVAAHLTKAEWDTLSEYARAQLPKDRLLINLGALLEDATPWEREAFLRLMPMAARVLWRLIGQRQYQRECQKVRLRTFGVLHASKNP
ncbi:hemerythrin domain-containing protein [Nonomuraea aurantiaca]|uniref:hemerythrin domain-containing protein n=1 Tax=Nonomuraea aurantiaca TaxID=2878562 RepID=UPI001CDA0FBD|nr:hemerythrin domain-containing protein [Nonomuraea aurantiaca]MCA2222790.1 hemerythrin domain-containing protein [Nonomuraea aurantiaca]